MRLQLSDRERQVFESLRSSGEAEVLVVFFERLVDALTDTRHLTGDDIPLQVAAANKASAIIQENLIEPLSRSTQRGGEHERFD